MAKKTLVEIFLEKSGLRENFDKAYETFLDLSSKGEPFPVIAREVTPYLRPIVKQFTGIMGKAKLMAGAAAVHWKIGHISVEEIQGYLDQGKKQAQKDVSGQSKDAVDVAQKFLDGLNPEVIKDTVENNKGAVTQDMIEDIIAIVGVIRDTLPPKLSGYLEDVLPEIDELDDLIRAEADDFLKQDTGKQIDEALQKAKEKAADVNPDETVNDVQATLVGKLDEIDAETIKRICDYVYQNTSTPQWYGLMTSFFKFADEALDAFEKEGANLRDHEYKAGPVYQEKIREFLIVLENALDQEGLLPDHLDIEQIKSDLEGITGQGKEKTAKGTAPKPPRP